MNNIAVVIPCYKVANQIEKVIIGLPSYIRYIVLVDDCSTDETYYIIEQLSKKDDRIHLVKHTINQGVGGAMISGFSKSIELNADIIVKMDGDDQMDPAFIPQLIKPLVERGYHMSKGNRFFFFDALKSMPLRRRIGNLGLSFLVKAASGYWDVFDPTNGFFAIKVDTLKLINFDRLDKRYFFESSFLIELYYTGAKIKDIPMPARYGEEVSNLSIKKTLIEFPFKLLKAFIRRFIIRYFILDFSIYSIYLLIGLPLLFFGFSFGVYNWCYYGGIGVVAPTGTVMIAVLSIVISFQLLLSVIQYDTSKPLDYAGNE